MLELEACVCEGQASDLGARGATCVGGFDHGRAPQLASRNPSGALFAISCRLDVSSQPAQFQTLTRFSAQHLWRPCLRAIWGLMSRPTVKTWDSKSGPWHATSLTSRRGMATQFCKGLLASDAQQAVGDELALTQVGPVEDGWVQVLPDLMGPGHELPWAPDLWLKDA